MVQRRLKLLRERDLVEQAPLVRSTVTAADPRQLLKSKPWSENLERESKENAQLQMNTEGGDGVKLKKSGSLW